MTRFFAATASPAYDRRGVGPKPLPPTLCTPSGWESLHRAAASSDILCRPVVHQQAFHCLPLLAATHRKAHRHECHLARAARETDGLGTYLARPRMPSTGSTSSFDEVDRHDEHNRSSANGPNTLFARPRRPTWSGLPISITRAIPPHAEATMWPPSAGRDASTQSSAADLLSRGSRRTPHAQALGLSPRPTLASTPNIALGGTQHSARPKDDGAGWPLLAAPALGGQAVGAAPTSRRRTTTPNGMPGVPSHDSRRRCRPVANRVIRPSDAFCRSPKPVLASQPTLRKPGSSFPPPTKATAPQIQGAFHQRVPLTWYGLTPLLRSNGPPLVLQLGRWRPSFRHAFTPRTRER
jgi:hypothetical protein